MGKRDSAAAARRLKIAGSFVIRPGGLPGIARAKNGDLLVTGDDKICRSTDGGKSWGVLEPIGITSRFGKKGEGVGGALGIMCLKDGTLLWPLYDQKVNVLCTDRECELFVLRSEDNGRTWSQRQPVPLEVREAFAYGRIVELPDRTLLLPVWGMRKLGERWVSALLKSRDGGRSWGEYRVIAWDPYAGGREDNGFNETTVLFLPTGELLAILRQQQVGVYPDERPEQYVEPAHVFYRSFSRDGGDTWSLPQKLALRGTSPVLHLSARNTLMLGYREPQEDPKDFRARSLAVRISEDKGVTWENLIRLVDPRRGPDDLIDQWGYPDFLNLPDGRILVVFCSGKRKGEGTDRDYQIIGNILEETLA